MNKFLRSVLAALVVLAITPPIASAENPPRKILTGWIPYYSMKTALPDALNNADLIKEVMPFWYTLKYDGKNKVAVVTDLYAPANPSVPIEQPLTALRNAGFSIIPTITDGTAKLVLAGLLKSPASRAQIIDALMNLIRKHNYDGIDLDFEGFAFVDGNNTWKATAPHWVALVKELSAALKAENKLLSVSTPYVWNPNEKQKGYFVYAWADIAPYIDRLRIMTYDYSVAKVGPIGPLAWTEKTVKYAVSIMPASKVYLGVPGYGRDWVTAVNGICPANLGNTVKVGAKAATFVMRNALSLAQTYGATPTFNEQFGESTFTYDKTYNGQTSTGLATSCTATRIAWYQDARGWEVRAALVDKYRLGGITAWTLGMQEPLATESIRNVAKQIAPDRVNVTSAVDKGNVDYGNPVVITATFSIKDKSPLANVPVRIEGKSSGETTWRTLATAITDVEGRIEKAVIVGKATTIRVYSEPTWERTEGIGAEAAITINRTMTVSVPGTVRSDEPLQLSGSIRPRTEGALIQVERLVGKEWRAIGQSVTTDSQGAFTASINPLPRGVATLRVAVLADQNWAQINSPTFNIIIR
jgi:spore germination protein YaaH